MELRHMRYFVAVAEELHFGRAAQRLHMAQSPLSRQIQGLERELGAALFERTTRSVALTDAGRELLSRAQYVIDLVDDIARRVREVDVAVSPVRLGFTACSAGALLSTVLDAARGVSGNLPVDLRSNLLTPAQLESVSDGRIDIGFVVRPAAALPAGLEQRTLLVEPLGVVLPDRHPLVGATSVRMSDLAGEDFVTFARSSGSAVRGLFDQACAAAAFEPRIVHETWETGSVVGLVAARVGISVLPISAREGVASKVAVRPILDAPTAAFSMVWRRSGARPAVGRIVDALLADLGDTCGRLCPLPHGSRTGGEHRHDRQVGERRAISARWS